VFLLALFVLASGVVVVQVVANPLISLLGPAKTAAGRLTFAQGFNALGTTLFPCRFGADPGQSGQGHRCRPLGSGARCLPHR
jgi:FHS family L-fucose permease-like MFS transporter